MSDQNQYGREFHFLVYATAAETWSKATDWENLSLEK